MRKLEILFPSLIILFTVTIVLLGVFYYDYSFTVMRFPYLVGTLLVLLAGWQLTHAIRLGHGLEDEDPDASPANGVRVLVTTGLWLVGILFSVQVFGYLAGIPLYLLVYFKAHGESWLTSISLSLGALLVTYFIFIVFLKVRLPVMPLGFG